MSRSTHARRQSRTVSSGAAANRDSVSLAASNNHRDADTVAKLAYSYWLARGCPDGSADEDWFRAEHDLQQQNSK